MSIEQVIPLNQLIHSKANIRQPGRTDGIGERAASIAAHGLRQNLNVQPSVGGDRFEVVAGGRRLRAMKLLAKTGKLAKDAPVTCLVLGEGDEPAEISLVENAVRTAMHPDDQFQALRALIEQKGQSVEEVAARFGVTPTMVRQRLKLASVSPRLRALFSKGEMGLDHVMALAISDDHAAQEQVWENLPDWNRDPSLLKDALTSGSLPCPTGWPGRWRSTLVDAFRRGLLRAAAQGALVKAVTEAKVTAHARFDGVKKPEAAKMAAKALAGSWLPEPLRSSL